MGSPHYHDHLAALTPQCPAFDGGKKQEPSCSAGKHSFNGGLSSALLSYGMPQVQPWCNRFSCVLTGAVHLTTNLRTELVTLDMVDWTELTVWAQIVRRGTKVHSPRYPSLSQCKSRRHRSFGRKG